MMVLADGKDQGRGVFGAVDDGSGQVVGDIQTRTRRRAFTAFVA